MKLKIWILLLSLCPSIAASYDRKWALKGGPGFTYTNVETFNGREDSFTGYGLNTAFGYRYMPLELNLISHVFFGKIDNLQFQANNSVVQAAGPMRSVSFGINLKYFTPWKVKKNWRLYVATGPLWCQQTVDLSSFTTQNGERRDESKLALTSKGGVLALGFEEMLQYKEMNAVYIEINYSYAKVKEVSVVDISNFREVQTLSSEDTQQRIRGNTIMLNLGMTVF
jgi:hypothetical protein